ncbi:tRNA (adenosine(37)-N6)-threonylcarbamoyltransferase complex ATPase subunit type 1 TsaE [Clostridia bacterium]|nr:tRNA (adenosine(37)-N6)-threonylcarbamoyltransferase complex ATPase subunit type 1 TsaE [Clostridia bacterium]
MISHSEKETYEFAKNMAKNAKAGQVYCLSGGLGAGKTVFAKGFAAGLGIDVPVTSPTFTIINEYIGELPLYHFDVWRVTDPDEMYYTGFEDYFYGGGVCLVEWAELVRVVIPDFAIWIKINNVGENTREIEVENGHFGV